jgi:hypothetical protein
VFVTNAADIQSKMLALRRGWVMSGREREKKSTRPSSVAATKEADGTITVAGQTFTIQQAR